MRLEQVQLEEKMKELSRYNYALIYYMSSMVFEKIDDLDWNSIDWDQCLEAYFFDENQELYVWNEDGVMKAVECVEEEEASSFDSEYVLTGKYKGLGKSIVIREYFEADEDGQACVVYKRLVGLKDSVN